MILSNQRRCHNCGDIIFSRHRHDYKTCTCGEVMVDGGQDYCRHSGKGENMSIIVSDADYAKMAEAIEDPRKNTLGKICNLVRVLRDDMNINISEMDNG